MQTMAMGWKVIALIQYLYRAFIPALLVGRHGIGKSEIFMQATKILGIECLILDLSVMEPPDLIGMPQIGPDGRTRYALPAWFPTAGRGIIVLEELNRCPRYMQAPCLQLLTARRIGDHLLPVGWLACAVINDGADGYLVESLDDAMLSRFAKVRVVPEPAEWASWAASNGTHARVIDFVAGSPGIFDDPEANPRAWSMASRFLKVWEQNGKDQELAAAVLSGLVGEKWALGFLKTYNDRSSPLDPRDVIEEYPCNRPALKGWVEKKSLDLLNATVELLKRHLQPQAVYEKILENAAWKGNVESFFSDLPAELRRQVRNWLADRGFGRLEARGRRR